MSFKEDFLEALRGVKRDLFSDNQAREELKTQPGEDAPPSSELPPGGQITAHPEPTAMPDNIVYEAFKQATAIEETDAGNGAEGDEDADDFGAEPELPPFRDFDPAKAELDNNGGSMMMDAQMLSQEDKTVISRNTVIHGALQTDDSLHMLGEILGDIECRSNIVVAGKIQGNTFAANAYIAGAQIAGDMVCDDAVSIEEDAWVLGNIQAQQAEVDGKVKGNLEIRNGISLGSSSAVIGDITTDELEIKKGAFVTGRIMMYSNSRDIVDKFEKLAK